MEKPDVNAIAARMVEAVKLAIARSESGMAKRLEELDARIKALPADREAIRDEVATALSRLPPAKDGADGKPGESIKGDPGKDGKDVDPLAVKSLVVDEVKQAVAAIPVPHNGKDGEPGKNGKDAEPVDMAMLKSQVAAWASDAVKLISPRDGRDGEPGKDAAELNVLPSIDESKSYRRGTWASHNGGLIRASRQTDAVKDGAILEAGWVVMVEGLSGVVVTQGDDPREIGVAAMLTSGAKIMSAFRMPAMIWRGIWSEQEYESGDVVTWGGSSWHCQQKTKGKPGECDDWKMMVKKGSAGRDWNDPKAKAEHKPVRLS